MNRRQKIMYESYRELDPDLLVLGRYRERPVIYTKLSRYPSEARHVVVLLKSGEPGDFPRNWEGTYFVTARGPESYRIIRDYLERMETRGNT